MIGSHNSATYLKEKNWWMILLRPWTKCQSKTVKQQYDSGVRYFDFRIKIEDTYMGYIARICHNNVIYNKRLYTILRDIDHKDVNIRLILDYRKKPENSERLVKLFESVIAFIDSRFDLKIDSAITFWDWKEFVITGFNISEKHYSVDSKHWYEWILGPYLFNRLKETNYKKYLADLKNKNDEKTVILKDFV